MKLLDLLKTQGLKIDDEQTLDIELRECIGQGRAKLMYYDNLPIGVFTYEVLYRDGKKHIYINNFVVFKSFRPAKLFFLRDYFRAAFPDAYRFYWHRDKYDRYTYGR